MQMRKIVVAVLAMSAGVPLAANAQLFSEGGGTSGLEDFQFSSAYDGVSVTVPGTSIQLQEGLTLDLNTDLPNDYTQVNGTLDNPFPIPDQSVVYTIYRQDYSAVIGNTAQPGWSGSVPPFIKDIVGKFTAENALPNTGTYEYDGSTVWHHTDEGNFHYEIDLATRKGSGYIENLSWNDSGTIKVSGTLNEANIELQGDGGVGVHEGVASDITTDNATLNFLYWGGAGKTTGKYDARLFGPAAEEVAGRVYDIDTSVWQDIEIGFAGKRPTP